MEEITAKADSPQQPAGSMANEEVCSPKAEETAQQASESKQLNAHAAVFVPGGPAASARVTNRGDSSGRNLPSNSFSNSRQPYNNNLGTPKQWTPGG